MKQTKEILVLKTKDMFKIMLEVEIIEAETADLYFLTSQKINTMITGQFDSLKDAKNWFADTVMNKLVFWQKQDTILTNLKDFGFELKPQYEHLEKYQETGSFDVLPAPNKYLCNNQPKQATKIEFNKFNWQEKNTYSSK